MGSFLIWLSPRRAQISRGRLGDFIYGSGAGFLISQQVIDAYKSEKLSGLVIYDESVELINRTDHTSTQSDYFFARAIESMTMVDAKKSGLVMKFVRCKYCRNGNTRRFNRIIIDEKTWTGDDIFHPRGTGTIIASQRFVDMVEKYQLSNFVYKPAYEYGYDENPPHKYRW